MLAVVAAACGGGSSKPSGAADAGTVKAVSVKPAKVFAAPAGLAGAGQPQPNGTMWLLVSATGSKNIQPLDASSGKLLGAVPVSADASSIAELSTGLVALGTATASTGSVELRNGTSGALVRTVAVSAGVKFLAAGSDGTTVFALDGSAKAADVAMIDTQTGHVGATLPVSLGTVAVAPTPSGHNVYALAPNGTIEEIATSGGKATASFSVGHSGRGLAISPDGSQLYVLKGRGAVRNVAVVDTATEAVTEVLPAPVGTVAIALSPNGKTLYDAVGTATYGNVQAYSLAG